MSYRFKVNTCFGGECIPDTVYHVPISKVIRNFDSRFVDDPSKPGFFNETNTLIVRKNATGILYVFRANSYYNIGKTPIRVDPKTLRIIYSKSDSSQTWGYMNIEYP